MKGDRVMKQARFILKLFYATFLLSAFTFGGGYVIVSLMKRQFVDDYHWFEENEMIDLVSIAQSSPGAIAVNAAIIVGYRLAGFIGIITTVLATILPPFIIISIIANFYQAFSQNYWIALMLEGMQAGVAAVITTVVFEMASGLVKEKKPFLMALFVIALIAVVVFEVKITILIILSLLGGLVYSFFIKGGIE